MNKREVFVDVVKMISMLFVVGAVCFVMIPKLEEPFIRDYINFEKMVVPVTAHYDNETRSIEVFNGDETEKIDRLEVEVTIEVPEHEIVKSILVFEDIESRNYDMMLIDFNAPDFVADEELQNIRVEVGDVVAYQKDILEKNILIFIAIICVVIALLNLFSIGKSSKDEYEDDYEYEDEED